MAQLLKRTWQRSIRREELWSGNREEIGMSFFSRDSIIWWLLKTYRRKRRQYQYLFQAPEYAHLEIVRLKSPQMKAAWLAQLTNHTAIE